VANTEKILAGYSPESIYERGIQLHVLILESPGKDGMKVSHVLVGLIMGMMAFVLARGIVRDIHHVFDRVSASLQQ